jgi:hypothetical protein
MEEGLAPRLKDGEACERHDENLKRGINRLEVQNREVLKRLRLQDGNLQSTERQVVDDLGNQGVHSVSFSPSYSDPLFELYCCKKSTTYLHGLRLSTLIMPPVLLYASPGRCCPAAPLLPNLWFHGQTALSCSGGFL